MTAETRALCDGGCGVWLTDGRTTCITCELERVAAAKAANPPALHYFADTADLHAVTDWAARRRWSCTCVACSIARRDGYQPRSRHVVKGPEGVFIKRRLNSTGFVQLCLYRAPDASETCGKRAAPGSMYCHTCGKAAAQEN